MKTLREIFSAASGQLSSKRVFGALGIISSIALSWYCAINGIIVPSIADPILYSSCALLGVDSVVKGIRND